MKVFKFGGASIQSAGLIQNVCKILKSNVSDSLLVIISAIGKTTNALEKVMEEHHAGRNFRKALEQVKTDHIAIMNGLFSSSHPLFHQISQDFKEIERNVLLKEEYDFVYDQVVSWGEILASRIVATYLEQEGVKVQWIDARKIIRTDSTWREGKVQWEETEENCKPLEKILKEKAIITQGFLGSDKEGRTTTLGRDGSDFSAAIFASCLQAESVTIWKDVPGVMNADPKRLPAAIVFEELPFKEAAEMTYYGASVIHPKTIKPLAQKNIPLFVKNFDDPALAGTKIHECIVYQLPPLIVFKENQCLISCKVTDYTFFHESHIGIVFNELLKHNIKINVMQNSAISFSFCVDFRESKILKLIDELSKNFEVYYNTNLTLVTIKNYDAKTFTEYRTKPGVILEQSSRSTLQVLIKN